MPYKDLDQRKACNREVKKRARATMRGLWVLFPPYRSQSVEPDVSLDDPSVGPLTRRVA